LTPGTRFKSGPARKQACLALVGLARLPCRRGKLADCDDMCTRAYFSYKSMVEERENRQPRTLDVALAEPYLGGAQVRGPHEALPAWTRT
jgi:hypothetical protein